MGDDKKIFLVAQKDAGQDDPSPDDIYRIGTISTILQLLKLPDGTVKVLVEGGERARIAKIIRAVVGADGLPSTIITDGKGRILAGHLGLPSASAIAKWLAPSN